MDATIDLTTIRNIPLFSGVTDGVLEGWLSSSRLEDYVQGEVVFNEGDLALRFFVLVRGLLKVTKVNLDGQRTIVRMVNPGDLFGIAIALGRVDYPGTATAVTNSAAISWPATAWDTMLTDIPNFAVNAIHTMGQRVQELHSRVHELSTAAVEQRVAHTVLRLANHSGRQEEQGTRLDFPVTKQDIAEMSGTTLHTVSRILTAWEAAGLVESGRMKLLIRNPHRLLLIGNGEAPCLL